MANLIGLTLLNQFRVDAFLASGGIGVVYRVWDLKRNVPLAMKVLHAELAEDPSMFQRFQREANALKKLTHPNIVPFYGLYQTGEVDFLLQHLIDGPTLQSLLKSRKGPLPVDEALVYLKALCAALGYAHANGVVHCDVKPGNVMVDRGGCVYLTDFGIVRHSESTTTTMGAAGTPAYMAPEQIRAEPVSPATDIYALGVLLYEMLAGQRPFRGDEIGSEKGGATTNERIRFGHLNLQPPDPRTFNPDMPIGLANALLKALAKRPQDRYASTLDFFNAICLQAGATAGQVADRVVLPDGFPTTSPLGRPAFIPGSPPVTLTRPRPIWPVVGGVVGGLLVFVLAVAGVGWIFQQAQPPPVVPPPALVPLLASTAAVTQPPVVIPTATLTPAPAIPPTLTASFTPTDAPAPSATPTMVPTPSSVTGTDGLAMVYVPAGQFSMGSPDGVGFADEHPQHLVNLDAFWIDQTEVTNSMYAGCVGEKACQPPGIDPADQVSYYYGNPQYAGYPVTLVSWLAAHTYCNWAGERLPTEAEWEKAARGTDGRIYPWGNSQPTCSLANYNGCVGAPLAVGSHPAGAGTFGTLDMAGNLWEWVQDWYGKSYYANSPVDNPQGPATGKTHVVRGGSWVIVPKDDNSKYIRSANRGGDLTVVDSGVGFRCVLSAP